MKTAYVADNITVTTRNATSFIRGLIIIGIALSLTALARGTELLPLVLLGLSMVAVGVSMYFRIPISEVTLLGIEGKNLHYVSTVHPISGIGHYQQTETVLLDDIAYIGLTTLPVQHAGNYLGVRLYIRDTGTADIWVERFNSDRACRLIRKLLAERTAIQLLNNGFEEFDRFFQAYSDRVIETLPEGENFEPWKIDLDQRKHFSAEEWQLLVVAPLAVFYFISRADGEIQPEEISVFVTKLREGQQYRSFLVSELFTQLSENIDGEMEHYRAIQKAESSLLKDAISLAGEKLGDDESVAFARVLMQLAEELAHATGERNQWDRDAEQRLLEQLRIMLRLA